MGRSPRRNLIAGPSPCSSSTVARSRETSSQNYDFQGPRRVRDQVELAACAVLCLRVEVLLVELDRLGQVRAPRNRGARAPSPRVRSLRRAPVLEQRADRGAVGGEIERIVEQDSRLAVHDLVLDPVDPAGDDLARLPHRFGDREPEALGQALLHDDVGATLSALTIAAFSWTSVIGSATRCTRSAISSGSVSYSAIAWASTWPPSGSSVTDSTAGPAQTRCASGTAGAMCAANPRITPIGSFSASQRETWTTTRSEERSGRRSQRRAGRSIRPGLPSSSALCGRPD